MNSFADIVFVVLANYINTLAFYGSTGRTRSCEMACGYCPVNIKLFPKNNNTVNINLYPTKNCTCDGVGYNDSQCEQDVHCLNDNVEPMNANNIDRKSEICDTVNLNVSVNVAPTNPYTIMPPPPHKMCNKNVMIYNYHRKSNGKMQNGSGRSLSPLGYDSDESTQSYCSQGNVAEENGNIFSIYNP